MIAAVVALLAASTATPGELPMPSAALPRWDVGAAAGGGWDSNPLAAPSPRGSGFGTARAWVGRRFEPSDADELRLQVHYDGLRYDAASDLDLDRPELGLEWDHFLGERIVLRVVGRGAMRFQGDSARSGSDASARALLRILVGGLVGLRLGIGGFYRDAQDPSFGGGSGRLDGGVDLGLWRHASAVAAYAFEVGTGFATTSGSMGSRGRGRGMSVLGSTTTRHTASADLLQALPGGLFVQGGYAYTLERGAGVSADAHLLLAEVGWRR